MLSLVTNLFQFVVRKGLGRTGSHTQRFGAAYLMLLASFCLLVSPAKNLMTNLCMQSFQDHGYEESIGVILDLTTNPLLGTANMQKATILGYVFLSLSTAHSMMA